MSHSSSSCAGEFQRLSGEVCGLVGLPCLVAVDAEGDQRLRGTVCIGLVPEQPQSLAQLFRGGWTPTDDQS